jgi:hypothetical protein
MAHGKSSGQDPIGIAMKAEENVGTVLTERTASGRNVSVSGARPEHER